MTREERRVLRRRALAVLGGAAALIAAMLLLSVTASAAYDAAEAGAVRDKLSTALAVTGAATVTVGLMRFILWLDGPKEAGIDLDRQHNGRVEKAWKV